MSGSWVLKRRPDGGFDLVPRAEVSAWTEKHYPDKCRKAEVKFKMVERGRWRWINGELVKVSGDQGPKKAKGLQIIKDIEPFQNIAIDNGYIGGRRQKRDMMRAHNLIEVGNERPGLHPRDVRDQSRNRPDPTIVEALKRNSQGKWL